MQSQAITDPQDKARHYLFLPSGKLLLERSEEGYAVPFHIPEGCLTDKIHKVTMHDGAVCLAARLSTDGIPSGFEDVDLRSSFDLLSFEEYYQAGKSSQILFWDDMTQYCPRCGSATHQENDIMKKCPKCGIEYYPPIYTAIIVRSEKGDSILLVRARTFKRPYYGLVAGFLESGESLEQCVEREVLEETGLRVKDIRYFSSQPWPYPSGLMAGFTAKWESGDIRLQEEELKEAAFFTLDDLPMIPGKMSMARQLIDDWIRRKGGQV